MIEGHSILSLGQQAYYLRTGIAHSVGEQVRRFGLRQDSLWTSNNRQLRDRKAGTMTIQSISTIVFLHVLALVPSLGAAETLAAVQDGKALSVRYAIGVWKEAGDGLELPAGCRCLYAGKDLGPGDFRVSARLKLDRMQGTAASFTMNGSHVGFDGRGGKLFIEGPLFIGRDLSPEAAKPLIKPGRAFDLEIARVSGVTRFSIDNHEILCLENWDGPVERIGFRPHRNRMTLQHFKIQGNLVSPSRPFGTPVFTSGQDGYCGYRIPALAVTPKCTVLAICEGRKNSLSDAGEIDLLVKRSTDNGKTWGPQRVVWHDGRNTCGNPCVVVDRETGGIWLASCRNNSRVFMIHSDDDGKTWSTAAEITAGVKKSDWGWYATGPGSGIQIERGPHKGRLVIPCDHGTPKEYWSHVFYSDDHGKTWTLGGTTQQPAVNECQVVELADGTLMLNMRNYNRSQKTRQVALSDDGGTTWKDQRFSETLIEPVCQAAIERYRWPDQDKPGVILFSNPASASAQD